MKNLLSLSLLLIFGIFSNILKGQAYFETYINFIDSNGNNIYPIPEVVIHHTDSATHATNPIINFIGKAERPWGYIDSFEVDTINFDTAFTVNYFYCGQWHSVDTYYPMDHPRLPTHRLQLTIEVPCSRSCNAEFYISDQYLHYYNQYYFYAGQTGGAMQHEWDLGNGYIYHSPNVAYIEYDTVGTVTIKHTVRDTITGCYDSSFQTLNFPADCDADFWHQKTGGSNYRFTPVHQSLSYSNLWYVDSVLVDSSVVLNYTFTTPGYHSIKHISSYGNLCSDTVEKIINTSSQPCDVVVYSSIKYNEVTFTPPNSSVPYEYIFGDGDTLVQQGVVVHHYPAVVGQYYLRVNDLQKVCRELTQTIHITQACNPAFTWNSDSAFRINFSRQQTSNLSSRYIFSTGDTVFADSGTYQINSTGQHWIRHQIINTQGQISCQSYKWFYVSACGLIVNNQNSLIISGLIKFDNNFITDYDSLRVYLIYHDSINGTLTAIDSVNLYSNIDTPQFAIEIPCDLTGKYLIKAALLPNSKYYANYLPTYSENSLTWANANYCYPSQFVTLNFQAGTNPGGPGFIGGLISQGANKNFTPLEGIQVNLFNEQEDPVAYTFSTSDGSYAFNNLAYGKYKVVVEVLGRSSSFYWVTLDADNPKSEEKDFEVNSTYVSLLNSVKPQLKVVSRIYPNPTDDILYIDWNEVVDEPITIQLMSIDGKLLKSITKAPGDDLRTELSLDDLSQGLYLLTLSGKQGMSTFQIQKN